MAETRVDLKHLLEDIRDSYPCPVEEAILTELIANSLDSGCSQIDINVEPKQRRLTFIDNGTGMDSKGFVQYHDIASTGKVRGKGIGFAGVGAKLALLVCREVLTESRRLRTCHCSQWHLETDFKAPWDEMAPLGIVPGETGTGVRLHFADGAAPALLAVEEVMKAIRRHFYPLLDAEFAKVLSPIYPAGVTIKINGEPVALPEMKRQTGQYFLVRQGKRQKLLGIGFLLKTAEDLPESQRGLAISTFGKVIKRGWEWLGVTPKNPNRLTGVVELPDLVECLTTNKCDFLGDANSLQKYYKYRKAIQYAVAEVLEKLGETRAAEPKADKGMEKLQKEIGKVLGEILPDFPELEPLFGRKKSGEEVPVHVAQPDGQVQTTQAPGTEVTSGDVGGAGAGEGVQGDAEGPMDGTHLEPDEVGAEQAGRHIKRRKRPGLMIRFDEETGGDDIGWLRGSTLHVNGLHPACKRARENGEASVYVVFAAASTLSALVQADRTPLKFVQRFLAAWGAMR